MPFLRKASGGCAILGYTWATDGAVVEVSEAHARVLLAIPDADYTEVSAPTTFSEVVNDVPAPNKPIARSRGSRRDAASS